MNKKLHPALESLTPELVWNYFNQIRQIPRNSGNEEGMRQFLMSWAGEHNFVCTMDDAGNLLIKVPATPDMDGREAVCIQSHMDMVCVKTSGSQHNFDTDPIELKRDGNFIKAAGTTLGADNGIGISYSLSVATDSEVKHGHLELLFTIDEEQGLKGALGLNPSQLGMTAKNIINLDNEDIGEICVSSAGSQRYFSTLPVKRETGKKGKAYNLVVNKMRGGHSGVDIHLNRGNAIIIACEVIRDLGLDIIDIKGGQAANAIPAICSAIVVSDLNMEKLAEYALVKTDDVRRLYDCPDIEISFDESSDDRTCLSESSKDSLLNAVLNVFNGMYKMSEKIPGLVETSSNIGVVEIRDETVHITNMTRSSVLKEQQDLVENNSKIFGGLGFNIDYEATSPGWDGDPDSALVRLVLETGTNILVKDGITPRIMAIHAGLEPGAVTSALESSFGEKVNAVSFGPTIKNAHSPDEYVDIKTVGLCYDHLKLVLSRL